MSLVNHQGHVLPDLFNNVTVKCCVVNLDLKAALNMCKIFVKIQFHYAGSLETNEVLCSVYIFLQTF